MIETASDDRLRFSFPDVHPSATAGHRLPADVPHPRRRQDVPAAARLRRIPAAPRGRPRRPRPADWLDRGGVMLPMYQSRGPVAAASTAHYDPDARASYPFAIKVAAGKIDAVTGQGLGGRPARATAGLHGRPGQPWLDGFCVEKGMIRQFVAMPLGAGLHGRGANHRQGRARRVADRRLPDEARGVRAAVPEARRSGLAMLRSSTSSSHDRSCASRPWAWPPAGA